MAHILLFYSHKLFLSCQNLKFYNDALFPFTPTHLNLHFQKRAAGKFIHYTLVYIPKELVIKTLIGFLKVNVICLTICDSDNHALLKCHRLKDVTQKT